MMPKITFRHKIRTVLRARRTLVVCATLALITIGVVDRSIVKPSSRQLSSRQLWQVPQLFNNVNNNLNDRTLIAFSNDPESVVDNGALLIPASGPDPKPQRILDNLRRADPKAIDPLCSATSRVRITNKKTIGEDGVPGHMILQSMALDGTMKTVGGDEFYVKYTASNQTNVGSSPDAVAHITDLHNGMYELHFVQPFVPIYSGIVETQGAQRSLHVDLQGGKLEVNLDYTCGIGGLWPPAKDNWFYGGTIDSHWEIAVDSLMVPSITMLKDRQLPQNFRIFNQYDNIYGVGDSLMRQFVRDETDGVNNANPIFRRRNFHVLNIGQPLNMVTLPSWLRSIDGLLQEHPDAYHGNFASAFVLGSGVWDLANSKETIESHIEAMGKYIDYVQKKAPLAPIYWKSMTDTHVAVFDLASLEGDTSDARRILKYCTRTRAKALYDAQSEVLLRMKIPVLDMYNITFEAEEWHRPNDAYHYQAKFGDFLMNYFYPLDALITTS